MKHLAFALWLLLILTVSAAHAQTPAPPEQSMFRVTYFFEEGQEVVVRTPPDENLRIRAAPSAKSDIVLNIANGVVATVTGDFESILILDEQGRIAGEEHWWYIRLPGGTEGWALGNRNGTAFLVPRPPVNQPRIPCDTTPEPQLTIGEQGRVLPDAVVSLYTAPDSLNLIIELAGRDTFTVLKGWECGKDDSYWWQVQFQDKVGWLMETTSSRYLVEPFDASTVSQETFCPDAPSQRLKVGMFVKATPQSEDPITIRTRPTKTGIDAFQLYPDEVAEVVDGPLCYPVNEQNTSWWRIENERGVEGWVAEADRVRYLLTPYDPTDATPDANCILTTLEGVNLRDGAGAEYISIGSAAQGTLLGADAQAVAEDGTLWWRVISGGWVIATLVSEGEGCNTLPDDTIIPIENTTPIPSQTVTLTPTLALPPTVNPDAACQLTTLQGVNFRAEPRADAEKVGSADVDTLLEADAQIEGTDFFTWWHLVDEQGWVREDLVSETDGCVSLSTVEAP